MHSSGWLITFFAGISAATPVTLKLGYGDLPSPPYFYGTGNDTPANPGIAVTLARQVAASCGLTLVLSRWPNNRLYELMRQGDLDAGFMYSYREERRTFGVYPMQGNQPDNRYRITTLTYSYYARRDTAPAWDGVKLVPTRPVGANMGWSIVADLRAQGLPVEEATSTDANFRKLSAGRIDAVAIQEHIGDAYLERHPELSLTKLIPPISTKDYYIIFSHAWFHHHSDTAVCIWEQFGKLRESTLPGLLRESADKD